jgi:hypothetical protein
VAAAGQLIVRRTIFGTRPKGQLLGLGNDSRRYEGVLSRVHQKGAKDEPEAQVRTAGVRLCREIFR